MSGQRIVEVQVVGSRSKFLSNVLCEPGERVIVNLTAIGIDPELKEICPETGMKPMPEDLRIVEEHPTIEVEHDPTGVNAQTVHETGQQVGKNALQDAVGQGKGPEIADADKGNHERVENPGADVAQAQADAAADETPEGEKAQPKRRASTKK